MKKRQISSVFYLCEFFLWCCCASICHASTEQKTADQIKKSPSLSTQPNGTMLISLGHAIEMSTKQNSSLMQNQEKINQFKYQIPLQRALVFPSVSIQVLGQNKKNAVNGAGGSALFDGESYNSYSAGIHLNQAIFGYGSLANIESAKKDRDLAILDAEIAERELLAKIIQDYYQMILAARTVKIFDKQKEIVSESLSTAQKRRSIGRSQTLDVLQIQTQLQLLNSQIENAKNQLDVAVINMVSNWEDQKIQKLQVPDELLVPPLKEIDALMQTKNIRLLELEKNRILMDQIQDKKSVALGPNLPSLSFIADYGYSNYKFADLADSTGKAWSMGLQLTIPIFTGLSSIYQQKSILSSELQLSLEKKSLENKIFVQQLSSRKLIETTEKSILIGETAFRLAEKSLFEARKNFKYATIDFLAFLNVQQAYVQAESSLNLAKFNYIAALVSYFSSSGQDLRKLVGLMEKK